MPVMDGLTATKAIRQMERAAAAIPSDSASPKNRGRSSIESDSNNFTLARAPSPLPPPLESPPLQRFSKHTPIIGVTASVSEEDRAICLNAGMDGFVQKPIRRDLLLSLLHEWTATRKRQLAQTCTSVG